MEKIPVLLTPPQWLKVPLTVRLQLAKDFRLPKSEGPSITTGHGTSVVNSDGHTLDDLRGVNVKSMHDYLGFDDVDEKADFFALFDLCCQKAERRSRNADEPAAEKKIKKKDEDGKKPEEKK